MPVVSATSRLWIHALPYRRDFAWGLVFLLGTNALAMAIPWILRAAIEALSRGTTLAVVTRYAGAMAALALVQGWVRTRSRLRILGASRRIAHDLRTRFYARLTEHPASWYDANRTGDVMSRGVNDVQLLQSLYGPGALNLLNTAIVYVGATLPMLRLDPLLTGVSLTLFPLLYLGVNRISKGVYARSIAVQEQLAALSNRTQENLSGSQQVRIFAQEEREIAAFREASGVYRERNLALARTRGLMIALIGAFAGCGTLFVLLVGGWRVIRGDITFGDFVAFNAYLGILAWPTVALGWIVNVFQRGLGALERLEQVIDARPEPRADDDGDLPPLDGDLEIRGLTFAHAGAARPALRDVTLRIPKGSRVALVGPVGSGKSTLANLLARVYSAPEGTIYLGGVDLAGVPAARARRSVSYVPQEAFLFSRALSDNVAFGAPDAAEAEVSRAVAAAGLARDVAEMPEGLGTVVGERGFTLSGGQRQRATLARALVRTPGLLVLDDALSAVDADTERAILASLEADGVGRTLLLVTHRVASLSGMERVIVLDEGRVVEDGSPGELLARDGLFASLVRRQRLTGRLEGA